MAFRTDIVKVGKIIEIDPDVDDLSPFIEPANMLVTDVVEGEGETTDETKLTIIETWLAAHFYAIFDPRLLVDDIEVLRSRIESKVDLGLDVTRYGQMAMRLDTSGKLAELNEQAKGNTAATKKYRVSFAWLGKKCE